MFNVAAVLCLVPCFITLHETMVRIVCFEVSSLRPLQMVCRSLVSCPHQNITNPQTGHHSLYSALSITYCMAEVAVLSSLPFLVALADHGRVFSIVYYFTLHYPWKAQGMAKQAMRISFRST